jgi:large subunit ribosomal protein L1
MKRGKKYLKAIEQVDKLKYYELDEAVDLIKKTATAKFNETVECVVL